MPKSLYIAEKPSVAQEFSNALKINARRSGGYIESAEAVITWCVGHLVTMSYPEAYDPKFKRWSLETLPFLPKEFKYQIIEGVSQQFKIVSKLLNREDIETIYICTDSGREGEYIYRLVDQMAGVSGKTRKRVWIDSQTEEEILRGIQKAKDWTEYDNLSASAYLRAKEDYLMGINFSRLLTLKYGPSISSYLKKDHTVLSVGRVMTCVLGMVVRREREFRDFVKTPFYRVQGNFQFPSDLQTDEVLAGIGLDFDGEWRSTPSSKYFESPYLYKENGFKDREHAQELIQLLSEPQPMMSKLAGIEKKKETKNPPLLYNLAELQNDCSRMFKISPDETLRIVQELYEKKLVTYPRTDARVLSTAASKEIYKNISGLKNFTPLQTFVERILESGSYKGIAKTRYVNDKQITDHYAIVPTGQGFGALKGSAPLTLKLYEVIARRFLSIFYPAAVYQKYVLDLAMGQEHFFSNFKLLLELGYLEVAFPKKRVEASEGKVPSLPEDAAKGTAGDESPSGEENIKNLDNPEFIRQLGLLKKGMDLPVQALTLKEGETSPPKRYTSGSIILAMESAGQLIEDEELRAQIKGSGIGTSATRAEILKKLVTINYLELNGKTQVITPAFLGEIIFDVVNTSIKQLLNPDLTASWEKGLTYVSEGSITPEEYMEKLEDFVTRRTNGVLKLRNQYELRAYFDAAAVNYKKNK